MTSMSRDGDVCLSLKEKKKARKRTTNSKEEELVSNFWGREKDSFFKKIARRREKGRKHKETKASSSDVEMLHFWRGGPRKKETLPSQGRITEETRSPETNCGGRKCRTGENPKRGSLVSLGRWLG